MFGIARFKYCHTCLICGVVATPLMSGHWVEGSEHPYEEHKGIGLNIRHKEKPVKKRGKQCLMRAERSLRLTDLPGNAVERQQDACFG